MTRLTDRRLQLPMVPAVAAKVIRMVQTDSATVHGLTEIIENDQVVVVGGRIVHQHHQPTIIFGRRALARNEDRLAATSARAMIVALHQPVVDIDLVRRPVDTAMVGGERCRVGVPVLPTPDTRIVPREILMGVGDGLVRNRAGDRIDGPSMERRQRISERPPEIFIEHPVIDTEIDDHAIVSSTTGPEYYVSIMSFVDKDLLEPGASVLLHHKSVSIVGVLTDDTDPIVSVMKLDKAPTESYADIGGLEQQIQEVRESVELPLLHPELYEEMGIKPPKGVILYGAPGTGKTLLAKAVANQTSATFLRIVGSELIQK